MTHNGELLVVKLSEKDAGEIEALFSKVWLRDAEEFPLKWRMQRTLRRKQITDEMTTGYNYFGTRINGRLVGVYKAFKTTCGLFGEQLSVDPTFRGQGLVTAMYRHLIKLANELKCKHAYVIILKTQMASLRIVQKFGFYKRGPIFEQIGDLLVQLYEKEV